MKKHLSRTAEILTRGRIGEGRYVGLTELDVVKNLFECLNGVRPYTLNESAVVAHEMNLRVGEIDSLFAAVGIDQVCERVRRTDALVEWYRQVQELAAAPQEGVPSATVEERIKDLVERRNQIAHGGGTPVELLGVDEMGEALGFIQAFARSVFAVAVSRYLRSHHAGTGVQLAQRQGNGPYQNGQVVIVEPPATAFAGQPVFVLGETIAARWGRIQSIQLDGATLEVIEAGTAAANGLGIKLDFKCPKDADLVALAADDDMVWSPQLVAATPAA